MTKRLSRHQLAKYCAAQLLQKDYSCIDKLAAYLIDSGRVGEVDLVVRDIEAIMLESGVVIADIVSAQKLTEQTRAAIGRFLRDAYDAEHVESREHVEPDVIGGVRIRTADAELDGTVQARLQKLMTVQE